MTSPNLRIAKDLAVDLSGRAIEVLVGPEPPVPFSVHEAVVRKASEFFDKALSHEWKESKERSVSLPDTDPDTFKLYLHWLYFRLIPVKLERAGHTENEEYLQLAKAYVLGDVLQDIEFNDAVTDAMIDKSRTPGKDGSQWFPVGPVIACIYNNTPASSEARRLLVDFYVCSGHGGWLDESVETEDSPQEFLLDLARALLDRRPRASSGNPGKIPKSGEFEDCCKYHRHGFSRVCYRNVLSSGTAVATKEAN